MGMYKRFYNDRKFAPRVVTPRQFFQFDMFDMFKDKELGYVRTQEPRSQDGQASQSQELQQSGSMDSSDEFA